MARPRSRPLRLEAETGAVPRSPEREGVPSGGPPPPPRELREIPSGRPAGRRLALAEQPLGHRGEDAARTHRAGGVHEHDDDDAVVRKPREVGAEAVDAAAVVDR